MSLASAVPGPLVQLPALVTRLHSGPDLDLDLVPDLGLDSRLEWLEGSRRGRGREGTAARAEDLLTEVHGGLSALGTTIKIVTALLTVLGADSTQRDDEYEAALSSLMGLGSAMVKLGGSNLIDSITSPSTLSSKLGVAAPTGSVYTKVLLDKPVSDMEALHRKQVATIVAQLTPDQIAAQQVVVEKHVTAQADVEGLTEVEMVQLQIDTLQHNGLPLPADLLNNIQSATSSSSLSSTSSTVQSLGDSLGGLLGSAQGLVGNLLSDGDTSTTSTTPPQHSELPQQGTLEHTIMLNLFNAQQSLNMFLSNWFGPPLPSVTGGQFVASDKIGEVSSATGTQASGGGLLSLPSKLLRAVLPGPDTGVSPSTAALGLLTTGAIGSVIYSYAANAPGGSLATSATALALGAVQAIGRRRDEVVAAASNALAVVTGAEDEGEGELGDYYYYDEDSLAYSDYSQAAPGRWSDYGYTYSGRVDTGGQAAAVGQEAGPSVVVYPDYDYQDSVPVREAPARPQQGIQFYEPTPAAGSVTQDEPETEYSAWAGESPWAGGSTDHLYRRRRGAEEEPRVAEQWVEEAGEEQKQWVAVPTRLAVCEEGFVNCRDGRNRKACLIRRTLCRKK